MDTDTDGAAVDSESKDAPTNVFPTSFMSTGSPVSFASITGIGSGFSSNHSFGFSQSNNTSNNCDRVPLFGRGTSFGTGTSSSSASTFQSSFGALESSSASNKRSRKPINEGAVEDILGQSK